MRIILTRLSGTSGLNYSGILRTWSAPFCPIGSSSLFIMMTLLTPSIVSFFGKGANERKCSIYWWVYKWCWLDGARSANVEIFQSGSIPAHFGPWITSSIYFNQFNLCQNSRILQFHDPKKKNSCLHTLLTSWLFQNYHAFCL